MRIVVLAVTSVALLFLAGPAAAAPAREATTSGKVAFDKSVPKLLKRSFNRAVSQAPGQFQKMVRRVDGQLLVSMGSKKRLKGSAAIATWRSGRKRPYRIYFSKAIKWSDLQGRIVSAHELGHIFDFAGVSGEDMRRVFLKRIKRSSRYKKCFKRPDDSSRCMPLAEVFADQVAYYAIPETFTSGYGIPRLLSNRGMERVLKEMWRPQATPGGVGGE